MTMTAEERADFRALFGDFFARQAGEDRLRRYLETPTPEIGRASCRERV